jgi:putative lysine transport system substrate-binding protein
MKPSKRFQKLAAAVLAISCAALTPLSGCSSAPGAQSTAPQVASTASAGAAGSSSGDKKVLKVAMECVSVPFNWTQMDDSNGALPIKGSSTFCNGYEVQILKKVADDLGYSLEIDKTEWSAIPPAVQSGKVDAGMSGMTVTEERKKTLLFTDPYYIADNVALVKADGKYADAKSLADLAGAECTSQQSTSWYTFLSQIPNGKVQPALPDVPTMLVALTSGKCDMLPCDTPTALSSMRTNPGLKMIKFEEGKGFKAEAELTHVCMALKLGNTDLKEKIDGALKKISEDERQKLMDWAVENEPTAS